MAISFSSVVVLVVMLFFVRFSTVVCCFDKNLVGLWRQGHLDRFPDWVGYIALFFGLVALFVFVKKLKNTDIYVKKSYFFYMLFMYICLVFSNRQIHMGYSYQYVFQRVDGLSLEDFINYVSLDFFFEAPYAFWSLLFMGIVYIFFKRKNQLEYAFPFWLVPLIFIDKPRNDIIDTASIVFSIVAIIGMKYSKKVSSILYSVFNFIVTLVIFFHFYPPNNHLCKYVFQVLVTYYTPVFLLLAVCNYKKKAENMATTWAIPMFTCFFMLLPLLRLPTSYALVAVLHTINAFMFSKDICLIVSIILGLAILIQKLSYKASKILLYFLSAITVVFYALDSVLFYYSNFRLDYVTIKWTMHMNKIATTLKTCYDYISINDLMVISLLFMVAIALLKFIKSESKIKSKIGFTFLLMILSAHVSGALMSFSDGNPMVTRDTFMEFLKSIPQDFFVKTMTKDEIEQGLKNCNINPIVCDEKTATKGNGYNLILVTLESVHWKYLNMLGSEPKTWPEMGKYKDRMEVFPLFFSCFPESTTADFSVITGLQPKNINYIQHKGLINCKTVVDEVKKVDYEAYMFISGSVIDGNLISFVKPMPLDHFFGYDSDILKSDATTWYWGYKEDFIVGKIYDFLKNRKSKKPYFLWYRTVYPHSPFTRLLPEDKEKFKQPDKLRENKVVKYKNALLYLDMQLERLVKNIDEMDKENNQKTIFVFIADHGEMLGEKEFKEFNGHGVYADPELTAVPCIILRPSAEGLKINKTLGSQIDALPTMLDLLELEPSNQRIVLGKSLLSKEPSSRPVYLSSTHSYALIEDGHYFYFENKNSEEAIISKIEVSPDGKPIFIRIEDWSKDGLKEKYSRTKKYFELQGHLLRRY